MLKKITMLAGVMCLALVPSITALAADSTFNIIDEDTDKVEIMVDISEFEKSDEYILYVLNPGYTESGFKASTGNVKRMLQYSQQKTASDELVFDFTMDTSVNLDGTDGLFTYIVKNSEGTVATDQFTYYSKSVKDNFLASLENNTSEWEAKTANVAENTYNYFGMQGFTLYKSVKDKSKIGEYILTEIKNGESSQNVEQLLKVATVVCALSEQTADLLDENGKIKYIDLLEMDDEYKDCYKNSLNADGLKVVLENSYTAQSTTVAQVVANMKKQIVVAAVYHNNLIGSGHIEDLITKFRSDFVSFGLNTAKYDACTTKGTVLKTLYNEGERTGDDMAARINQLTASVVVSGGSSGGGSSGSSGGSSSSTSGGTTGGGFIQNSPTVNNTSETVEVEPIGFEDLDTVLWAKDSINNLVSKGIVSGRDISTFAPNDSVTREEFATMLTKAFALPEDNATANFGDVSKSRWSYSYIAAGSSAGIMQGDGVNFYPQKNITRQDISAMIVRTLMYKGLIGDMEYEEDFCDDYEDIAEYARESVQILYKNNIVIGDGTGKFNPLSNATRAEAAVIISNAISYAEEEGK